MWNSIEFIDKISLPKIKNVYCKACNDGLSMKDRLEKSKISTPQWRVFCNHTKDIASHLIFSALSHMLL